MRKNVLKLILAWFLFFPTVNLMAESYGPEIELNGLDLQQKLQLIDQEAAVQITKAYKLMQEKKIDESLAILEKVNKFAPYQPQAYILQLRYYQATGQEDRIYKTLETAGKSIVNFDIIFQALQLNDIPERKLSAEKIRLADFKDDKQTAISFNFDDGPRSVFTQALPILDSFGYKATLPINPIVVTDTFTNPSWGSWDQWKDAYKRGFEIANHAYRHRKLTEVLPEKWDHEINGSSDIIKEKIGAAPLSFVFPHDDFNPGLIAKVQERHLAIRVHDILKEAYPYVYIPVYGGEYFSLNTANQIIDLALKRKLWLVPECHAIYSEEIKTYKPLTAEFLKAHLQYIKSREDRIWVDTFINVYSYLLERKNSDLEVIKNSANSIVFKVKTPLTQEKIRMPLTAVIDISPNVPKKAAALQGETVKKKLPVKIIGFKILIDVLPGSEEVKVEWGL